MKMKGSFKGVVMRITNQMAKIIFGFCLLTATAAFAVDLQGAKSQGLIGEQLNGYLGIVAPEASKEVKALVADVNNKRKKKYQSIAEQNGTSLDTVELLAGKKAIEKTVSGNYIQSATGWKKK